MKFWKKTVWMLIAAVTVAGILLCGVGLALGASRVFYMDRSGVQISRGEYSQISEELDVADFDRVIIYADLANVEVSDADSASLLLSTYDAFMPSYEITNRTLKITQPTQQSWLNMNFSFLAKRSNIKLFLPAEVQLKELEVRSNMGSVKVEGITSEIMTIEADLGDVEARRLTCSGKLSLRLNCGNLTLSNTCTGTLYMSNDLGSLAASGITSGGTEVRNNAGNIDLDGSFSGETTISCDLGSVSLTVAGPLSLCYDLRTDLGNITVDGKGCGTRYINSAAQPDGQVYITNDLGSIRVRTGS